MCIYQIFLNFNQLSKQALIPVLIKFWYHYKAKTLQKRKNIQKYRRVETAANFDLLVRPKIFKEKKILTKISIHATVASYDLRYVQHAENPLLVFLYCKLQLELLNLIDGDINIMERKFYTIFVS
jgi:hypothetical protein